MTEHEQLEGVTLCTEADVRKLRNKVYGKPITDDEWSKAKVFWMADVQWLIDHQPLGSSPKS